MPSLNELGQFKSSFSNIANEKNDIESLNLPFDDLELPGTDAPPFNYSRNTPYTSLASGDVDFTPDTDSPEPESSAGNFDFSSFLDNLPTGTPPSGDAPASSALSAIDDLLNGINEHSQENVPDTFADQGSAPDTEPDADDTSFFDDFSDQDQENAQTDNLPDFSVEDVTQDSSGADSADNFSMPDDLLAGFGDEVESSPLDFPEDDFSSGDSQTGVSGLGDDFLQLPDDDFSLDTPQPGPNEQADFHDIGESIDLGGEAPDGSNIPGDISEADDFNFDAGDLPDFDTSADNSLPDTGDFDLSGGSIDLGGESMFDTTPGSDVSGGDTAGAAAADSGTASIDDFSMDNDLPDFGAGFDDPGLTTASDASLGDFDDSLFDLQPGTDSSAFDADLDLGASDFTPSSDDAAALDLGDFGTDFASDSIELENTPEPAAPEAEHLSDDIFGSDDFSLAGLDDILNKSKVEPMPASAPPPKKGLFGRKKAQAEEEEPEAEENIDEISLKQEDVDKLVNTLSQYPLNMRIICEELIAEQVILPQQLSKLIRLLVNGAHVKETAAHVESITGKPVIIPKSFEKMTGAAFEEEQASFGYIFVHNFLPVIRLVAFIVLMAGSVLYLAYRFIYTPLRAESIYKRGYERIPAGEYQRANELFHQAFEIHRKKNWFYSYAEAFRDQRRYSLAEGKYDELLRYYPRDKKGILDYAKLNTDYLLNYEKANNLLQRELLDYAPNDKEGLLAAGDNFLRWGDSNPAKYFDKYEDARFSYARLLDLLGWQPALVQRMMAYFIRVDNLRETLNMRTWFDKNPKHQLPAESLAELGGYLLDKQLEKPAGVPDPYVESIESVRDMLLKAVMMEPTLPEPHYHLARYHHNLNNNYEERRTLENAIRAFNLAQTESVRRRNYRVDTQYRYANLLINNREFFPAEEEVVRGIQLFEDYMNRNLIPASEQLGQLYALKGDLEFFVKSGNMEAVLNNYHIAERYNYSPPEIQYRMGAAYYQQGDWNNSLNYLFKASAELPFNRRLLYSLGNAAYQRGDYFAAQGYYTRLLDILENQRTRLPELLPNDNAQFLETGERLMYARNNLGAANEALAEQTGNRAYRSSALVMYTESARAWDAITRNPETMVRSRLTESSGSPSINLGYLNANNALRPSSDFAPQIFPRIDKDVLEPSKWEELTGY